MDLEEAVAIVVARKVRMKTGLKH
ncbi:hypothetical protein M8C21_009707, partial [Ambrosia artemisiifolia]